jgi:hypothetical protein
MPSFDPFSAQIVQFVRQMPAEAILALVRQRLGVSSATATVANGKAQPRALGVSTSPKPGRRTRATSADRVALLDTVERVVKAGSGLSASDVAKAAGVAQPRVAAAIRELKQAKRIFQGGDRRFARYAADTKTAQRASIASRKGR